MISLPAHPLTIISGGYGVLRIGFPCSQNSSRKDGFHGLRGKHGGAAADQSRKRRALIGITYELLDRTRQTRETLKSL
jgi:hypothetical protein